MAVLVAMALPVITLVSLGAVQLQAVIADRTVTQDVADAAALWGAQQLTLTKAGAAERTEAFADTQLDKVRANATVTVDAQVIGATGVKVMIDTHRPSFFFNLMPLGGFHTHVEAVAEGVSQTPLCVLIIGSGAGHDVHMTGQSKLQGPACMVHSNHAVRADGGAMIQGKAVQAGTTAVGPISPTPSTGAPQIPDPFASLSYAFPQACSSNQTTDVFGILELDPGVHQRRYDVKNGATLKLKPGEHYFCRDIDIRNKGSLTGDDVVLIFYPDAELDATGGSKIDLNGRKSGWLAGFVILVSRSEHDDFRIDADPIVNITGTIYVPNAELVVEGTKLSGTSSAWTVLAVEQFEGRGAANLVINADYGGTDVPAPAGVGNRIGTTRLTQ